jgi:dipeptidyl aminopeptidase/acylaminoacyl peptidase
MIPTSLDGSRIAFIGATREDGFVLRHATLSDGQIGQWREAFRSQALTRGPSLSFDGRFASLANTERSGNTDTETIVIDLETGERAASVFDEGGANSPGSWAPHSHRLLGSTNVSGVARPYILDIDRSEVRDLPMDLAGDVSAIDWSEDERTLLVVQTWHARIRLFSYNIESQELTEFADPGGSIQSGTFWRESIVAILNSPERPVAVVEMDRGTGAVIRTLLQSEPVAPGTSWKSVTFPSSGRSTIQGWLALPDGRHDAPGPAVIEIHGGPTAVTVESNQAAVSGVARSRLPGVVSELPGFCDLRPRVRTLHHRRPWQPRSR